MATDHPNAGSLPGNPSVTSIEPLTETKNGAAVEPRDPHAMWWVDYQRKHVEYNNSHLILGEEDTEEENDRKWGELSELMKNVLATSATTFEGFGVQLDVLQKEAASYGADDPHIANAFRSLRCFVLDIEAALERRELKQEIERAAWSKRCYSAPAWKGHPAMPADVEEIHRAERELAGRASA
jgi:hypothetical protein